MDLIHPSSKADVAETMRGCSEDGTRVLVVGGRTHVDKGNPSEVDAELWTTQLDRVIAYEPAEMVAVVEAGIRVSELDRVLADGGQEWPFDAPATATVGGVIAAAASSPRRLRVGAVRDTVLEIELVTGDGRTVKSGGRTVKNVSGYDVHKLMCGSLGTLGVIVQVALKLRPRPRARRTVHAATDHPLEVAQLLLDTSCVPTAVLALPDAVELRLEGWPEEVREQTEQARRSLEASEQVSAFAVADDVLFPRARPWEAAELVAEVAVPPSRVAEIATAAGDAWGALFGVGLVWVGLETSNGGLTALRERVASIGGIAPVVRGPGGLGSGPLPAHEIQRRLKRSFDPAGVLAPGRFWDAGE